MKKKQKARKKLKKENKFFKRITVAIVLGIIFWCVGIVSLGRQLYPQVGKWLIILGSVIIYSGVVILAWKI